MSRDVSAQADITRRANRLRAFVILLMIAMPLAGLLIWLRPAGVRVEFHDQVTAIDPLIAAGGVTILLEIALFELVRMLSLIGAGEYYSVRVVRHFRNFAGWLLSLALIAFFASMLRPSQHGEMKIEVRIDFNSLLIVGLTLLLFLLARVLERAGEIEQENREIV